MARCFFMIKSKQEDNYQIWVSENGSRITKLVSGINEKWVILNLMNAPSELLAIYEPNLRRVSIYALEKVRLCLGPEELQQYRKHSIENFSFNDEAYTSKFFYFNSSLYMN